jgi:hypothetical protein
MAKQPKPKDNTKHRKGKLPLHKERLRSLNSGQLGKVGGGRFDCDTTSSSAGTRSAQE